MTTETLRNIGVVKWFDSSKGYGFLKDIKTNEDIFVHFSKLANVQTQFFKTLYEGEYVSYSQTVMDDGKTLAVDVTGVGGGKLMCEASNRNRRPRGRGDARSNSASTAGVPSAEMPAE